MTAGNGEPVHVEQSEHVVLGDREHQRCHERGGGEAFPGDGYQGTFNTVVSWRVLRSYGSFARTRSFCSQRIDYGKTRHVVFCVDGSAPPPSSICQLLRVVDTIDLVANVYQVTVLRMLRLHVLVACLKSNTVMLQENVVQIVLFNSPLFQLQYRPFCC